MSDSSAADTPIEYELSTAERFADRTFVTRNLQEVDDFDLIATAEGENIPLHEMEMQRRLKGAIADLTTETISARDSADAAADRLIRLTRWLIAFTIALVVLTVAVAILSGFLLVKG